jgi:hypothetical protein
MTSLTFSLAILCKEINELVEENKLTLSYYEDEDCGCKSYFFTHLDEIIEDQNGEEVVDSISREKRLDKKNHVDKIDYHNINFESAITVFIDELRVLFDTEQGRLYQKGELTTLVLIAVHHGYDLFENEHLWRIEAEYKDFELEKLVDKERQEYVEKQKKKPEVKKMGSKYRKLEAKEVDKERKDRKYCVECGECVYNYKSESCLCADCDPLEEE